MNGFPRPWLVLSIVIAAAAFAPLVAGGSKDWSDSADCVGVPVVQSCHATASMTVSYDPSLTGFGACQSNGCWFHQECTVGGSGFPSFSNTMTCLPSIGTIGCGSNPLGSGSPCPQSSDNYHFVDKNTCASFTATAQGTTSLLVVPLGSTRVMSTSILGCVNSSGTPTAT